MPFSVMLMIASSPYLILWVFYTIFHSPKGSFVVKGYKNGKLLYQETITNRTYEIGPNGPYDKMEIIDEN